MKKILNLICLFVLAASFAACGDKMPDELKDVKVVESVALDESIANGAELEVGDNMSIAGLAIVEPVGATNRAEYYSSSDTGVATVSEEGIITAVSVGSAIITVTVGGINTAFTLTVIPVKVTPLTSISFSTAIIKVYKGESVDVSSYLSFAPEEAAKDISMALENTDIATVDGTVVTAKASGEVKLMASSRTNPSLKAETTIGIPTGDLNRTGWTCTLSLDISGWTSLAEGNSVSSAIDGQEGTNLCIPRPGKSFASVSNTTGELWFYIDLGAQRKVNYFHVKWRYEAKELFCRVFMFDEILGSNDAVNWTSLGTEIYTGAEEDAQNSANLFINEGDFRYYKFSYYSEKSYLNPSTNKTQGSSSQINEIYLGYDEYYVAQVVDVASVAFDSSLKPGLTLVKGAELNLAEKYTISPKNATDKSVSYASSAPTVATVSEAGLLTAVAPGTATISITASGFSDSFELTVKDADYDRSGWTVTASQDVSQWTSAKEKNSLAAAIDGDLTTNLCLVRPGKSINGITNSDPDFWFCVNMGKAQKVNRIRFIWNSNEKFCRYYQLDEILGSNDGAEFTSVVKNLSLKGGGGNENLRESPIIAIPETTYQYYKFVCSDPICWTFPVDMGTACPWTGDNPRGGSSQFSEIYLGAD
ncbi:MAG: Ig-like domain-containing protein [Bacteroidales bacterium]|nr:Ig-like domain-containing protein [Bacteroidales bacterium]